MKEGPLIAMKFWLVSSSASLNIRQASWSAISSAKEVVYQMVSTCQVALLETAMARVCTLMSTDGVVPGLVAGSQ